MNDWPEVSWENGAAQACVTLTKNFNDMQIVAPDPDEIPSADEDLSVIHEWAYYSPEMANYTRVQIVEILAQKQADYGHENIMAYGLEGVRVRISDKLARIRNLKLKGADPENESLVDSYLDICGYCIIGQMLEDGTFMLPLAADMDNKPSPPKFMEGQQLVVEWHAGGPNGTFTIIDVL